MRVIIGLGNPGLRYRFTRHNLGFLVIDNFAEANRIKIKKKEFNSLLGRGRIGEEEIVLAKPLTYMNLSGNAVKGIVSKEDISLNKVMVISDDVNLPLGAVRIRQKGSAGGHNGLSSIIEGLNSMEFPRMRLGISRAGRGGVDKKGLTPHVLGPFRKKDMPGVNEAIDRAVQALFCWIHEDIQTAMSKFNS